MKVKKSPMVWYQKLFYIISFLFLIGAFMYLGTKDFNTQNKKLTPQESFTEEYGITTNNVYIYKNAKEILETINTGSGIIFMAYKENKWSSIIADLLNEVAKEEGIKEIYYYNFKKDRSNNNHHYENIVKLLTPYLKVLDSETTNIYAPTVLIIKNGEIQYFDDETSIVRGDTSIENYWSSKKKIEKKAEYKKEIEKYLGEEN